MTLLPAAYTTEYSLVKKSALDTILMSSGLAGWKAPLESCANRQIYETVQPISSWIRYSPYAGGGFIENIQGHCLGLKAESA